MSTLDVAVLARLRADLGGDDATMRELAEAFFSQSPRLLEDARAGAASQARERLLRAAHTLKSSAATLGALRLAELSHALETEAIQGPVPRADARVNAIVSEYEAVERDLRAWLAQGHQR